ncbi:MAG: hypothetical protein Q7J78_03505 [Clostridiales bacterium]|nr:hypothetical protein [Clostridiales bacterium]
MLIPNIGLIALAGQYEVGFKDTPELLKCAGEQLEKCGYNIIKAKDVMYDGESVKKVTATLKNKDFDLLCVCVGTWSEDHHLLDLLDYFDVPVILWAFPVVETGSLCGVQQICCVLKELGKRYFYVYGQPDNKGVLSEIGEISRAIALSNRLKHVKIGTIGGRIKGMTEIAFDELEIKDKTGVRIVNLDEDELTAAYNNAVESDASECWNNLKPKAGKVTASDEHGIEAIRYYFAMRSLIKDNWLEGLCIKCYPRFMGKICLGYSLLSEEGIVCGCEGDVLNTVSMKILYELTGQPIHNTDLLYPDPGLNTILFSHCGSGGFSIAGKKEDIHLGPVRLADSGICALFPAKSGKVTLINLVGRKGTMRMSVIVGEALECGMEFPGNPLKVRFDRDVNEINKQIALEGIGHHWMGGYGDVSRELEHFCNLKGIRFIRL